MSALTKRELQAWARAGGLEVEGNESLAELSEAMVNLVQKGRAPKAPEHDWNMPHYFGNGGQLVGCPPNCPRVLALEAAA